TNPWSLRWKPSRCMESGFAPRLFAAGAVVWDGVLSRHDRPHRRGTGGNGRGGGHAAGHGPTLLHRSEGCQAVVAGGTKRGCASPVPLRGSRVACRRSTRAGRIPPVSTGGSPRMARPHRSFFAYASALLGLLSLLAVACFHFPELL